VRRCAAESGAAPSVLACARVVADAARELALATRPTPQCAAMPKQKPNELCACGSGAKHKKCCAAKPAPAPAATARGTVPAEMHRLYLEGRAAQQANEWSRAQRRATSALLAGGEAVCAGHAVSAALCERFGFVFAVLISVQCHPGRCLLGEAQDCYARSLAMLLPPYTFWARALTTLSHAGWRDTPLGADDVRITLPAALVRDAPWSHLHLTMADAFRLVGRTDDAIACYERTLAALVLEPEQRRNVHQMASILQNLGGQHEHCGRLREAREYYTRGLSLVEHSREEDVQPLREMLQHCVGAVQDRSVLFDASDLQDCERQWAICPPDAPETPAMVERRALGVCCDVLSRTEHADAQRPWLLRGTGMYGAPLAQKSAAMLGCRACGASAAETKLRLCAGCSRVAYCGAACQAADWNARHKKLCTGRHAGTPEAALSDAVCVFCRRALVPEEHAEASASQYERCELLLCLHFAHTACRRNAGAGCPACV
jgi:hypothetical protein